MTSSANANKRLLDGMPYTNAANTTPDYLRARFAAIRAQLDAERVKKVVPIKAPK